MYRERERARERGAEGAQGTQRVLAGPFGIYRPNGPPQVSQKRESEREREIGEKGPGDPKGPNRTLWGPRNTKFPNRTHWGLESA